MNKDASNQGKRLATLAAETEKQKKELLAQLKKTPIVQAACERAGVGRSTYYKWRTQDRPFARAADQCLEFGRFLINDLAESRLIRMIQSDNLTAIMFWLRNNHPNYAMNNRYIKDFQMATNRPSIEEISITAKDVGRLLAPTLERPFTNEDYRASFEAEQMEAAREEPVRKRMAELMSDESEKPTAND